MQIFKKKVGRPSKEDIRKERIIKGVIFVAVIAVIALICSAGYKFLTESDEVESNSNNASLNNKVFITDFQDYMAVD